MVLDNENSWNDSLNKLAEVRLILAWLSSSERNSRTRASETMVQQQLSATDTVVTRASTSRVLRESAGTKSCSGTAGMETCTLAQWSDCRCMEVAGMSALSSISILRCLESSTIRVSMQLHNTSFFAGHGANQVPHEHSCEV